MPSENAVPGLEACGAANGVFATARCLDDGARAGSTALKHLGLAVPEIAVPEAEDAAYAISPFWLVEGKGRAWLDFQNDVTAEGRQTGGAGELPLGRAHEAVHDAGNGDRPGQDFQRHGPRHPGGRHRSLDTADRNHDLPPPLRPRLDRGDRRRRRRSGIRARNASPPSHAAAVECGASIVEAGLWYRPAYFPKEAEASWRESCEPRGHHGSDAGGGSPMSLRLGRSTSRVPMPQSFWTLSTPILFRP